VSDFNRFIVYLKQGKCHFFNNKPATEHGFNIVGDPFITSSSSHKVEFENFSLIYPNLKCRNSRPASFVLEGTDDRNRPFLEELKNSAGADVVYAAMCQLNGLDMLDSKFNKGTLDLEEELKPHPLYQDVFAAIEHYNSIYKKLKKKEELGHNTRQLVSENFTVNPQGDFELKEEVSDSSVKVVLSKDAKDSVLGLFGAAAEESWPPLQAAKEDLVYEFKVLLGRMIEMKRNGLDLHLPGNNLKIFRAF